jgi:hypothetical protein
MSSNYISGPFVLPAVRSLRLSLKMSRRIPPSTFPPLVHEQQNRYSRPARQD